MKWLKVNDAAEWLGLSPKTVRKRCRQKRLKHFRPGNEYLFRPEWLNDFIEERSENPLQVFSRRMASW